MVTETLGPRWPELIPNPMRVGERPEGTTFPAGADQFQFDRRTLGALLAQLSVGVLVADRAGRVAYANDVARRFWREGFPRSRDGSLPVAIAGVIGRVVLTGESVRDEECASTGPDGELRWFSVSGTPVRNGAGEVDGGVITVADATPRKWLEAYRPVIRSLELL